MQLSGIRSSYRSIRERTNLRQAIHFSLARIISRTSPVQVTIDGVEIYVRANSPDFHVADKTIGGEFEDIIPMIRPLRHKFIVDAGGYIGTVAIVLAIEFPEATIVTLEPSLDNFFVLQKNIKRYANIIALNAALGPSDGKATFYDHEGGPWGYSLLKKTLYGAANPKALHEVDVVSIPSVMSRFGAKGIDFLKLDIEGAEKELLADQPSWVSQVRIIAAELHEWVQPGCDDAFSKATQGRRDIIKSGELSISAIEY